MWKRDQAPRPNSQTTPTTSNPGAQPLTPSAPPETASVPSVESHQQTRKSETYMVHIGKSVVIKGDLQGSEDLTIEGQIEGKIELKNNVLTIGPSGRIKAQVFAQTVVVLGTVNGNITAAEKVDIRDGASVDGDVAAPKVAIAEGAQFHGSVDMKRSVTKVGQHNATAVSSAQNVTGVPVPAGDASPRAAAATH